MGAVQEIMDWSEVWALIMPLVAWVMHRKQPYFMKPVVVYIILAFIIDLFIDVIADFKTTYHFPAWLQSNNFLYNVHSIVRFFCFSTFFIRLRQPMMPVFKKVLPYLFLLFVLINFIFFEDFFYPPHLSGRLLATEAGLLLLYCILYYFHFLQSEEVMHTTADFWVATGLNIYVVINFFIFLFYVPMIRSNSEWAVSMWNYHNIAFIIFCAFLAKGLMRNL